MTYLPTVYKNAKYSNGQHIAINDQKKTLWICIFDVIFNLRGNYLLSWDCRQMERYIRTQSSPPSSPVSPARPGPGPGPATQSPLSSPHHHQPQHSQPHHSQPQPSPHYQEVRPQQSKQPPQPHYQLGEMRNGASTSSLDRVITPAKVGLSPEADTPLFWLDGCPPVEGLHQFSAGQQWEPPARLGHGCLRAASSAGQPEAGGDSHRPTSSDRSVLRYFVPD